MAARVEWTRWALLYHNRRNSKILLLFMRKKTFLRFSPFTNWRHSKVGACLQGTPQFNLIASWLHYQDAMWTSVNKDYFGKINHWGYACEGYNFLSSFSLPASCSTWDGICWYSSYYSTYFSALQWNKKQQCHLMR